MRRAAWLVALIAALAHPPALPRQSSDPLAQSAVPSADVGARLAGTWAGSATHEGESVRVAIEFESLPGGAVLARLTLPVVHVERVPVVKATPEVRGDEVRIGPFALHYDGARGVLTGTMPEALVPVHRVPFTLRRVDDVEDVLDPGGRPPFDPALRQVEPSWTFDAGAPCWPGASFSNGLVFAGCDDGRLHALEARTGRQEWAFRAGGPIRTRPTVSGDVLYFQADDGMLYAVGAADGAQRWRARIVERPVARLPLDDPRSRFDCFGSDVAVAGGRLFLGTHDGRVASLDARSGATVWVFGTGDAVTATPAVARGRVYAGSFDGHVYALDQGTGALIWKRDTRGAVVSTPAVGRNRAIVGNRAYDLLGLDLASGQIAWRRYIWFSWVESSAKIRNGIAYVGSSDAAALFAVDAETGRPIWKADVGGWAWGQPAVSDDRVYVGTAGQAGYMGNANRGGVIALDLRTGRPSWRFSAEPARNGPWGFPGSGAIGPHLVFFAGLDGRVYAFAR